MVVYGCVTNFLSLSLSFLWSFFFLKAFLTRSSRKAARSIVRAACAACAAFLSSIVALLCPSQRHLHTLQNHCHIYLPLPRLHPRPRPHLLIHNPAITNDRFFHLIFSLHSRFHNDSFSTSNYNKSSSFQANESETSRKKKMDLFIINYFYRFIKFIKNIDYFFSFHWLVFFYQSHKRERIFYD